MRYQRVRGHRIEEGEQPLVKTYETGRICKHELCQVALSKYNPDAFCGLHNDEEYSIPCDTCGTMLPFTAQFFWQTRGRLLTTCKECQGFKIRKPKVPCDFGEVT